MPASNQKEVPVNSMIKIEHLNKSYTAGDSEVKVLKDINLEICRGEFISIMGPSGSGKSTLLYLLGGLDKPTEGKIIINGKELAALRDTELSRIRRQVIGFIFQFYNLIPNLSVENNILLPILLDGKKIKQAQASLDNILNVVGLEHRRTHTPNQLSGGEQQRVAIARAVINTPRIILADEPTGNLDSRTGLEILKLLKRINQEYNMTIVMVTHSPEASAYGNRIIHIQDGKIKK